MKKLFFVSAVCLSTITLLSFKGKEEATLIIEDSVAYSVNVDVTNEFAAGFYEYQAAGYNYDHVEIGRFIGEAFKRGIRHAQHVWNSTGREAFWRALEEASAMMPPMLYKHTDLTEEDIEVAEYLGLIEKL